MLIHLLVIGSIFFSFVSVQWLSSRARAKKQPLATTVFDKKQEADA